MNRQFLRGPVCRWLLLVLGMLVAGICFYNVFMYGTLSVAPSPVQEQYHFLANLNLYVGVASLLLGVCAFFFLKKRK